MDNNAEINNTLWILLFIFNHSEADFMKKIGQVNTIVKMHTNKIYIAVDNTNVVSP